MSRLYAVVNRRRGVELRRLAKPTDEIIFGETFEDLHLEGGMIVEVARDHLKIIGREKPVETDES